METEKKQSLYDATVPEVEKEEKKEVPKVEEVKPDADAKPKFKKIEIKEKTVTLKGRSQTNSDEIATLKSELNTINMKMLGMQSEVIKSVNAEVGKVLKIQDELPKKITDIAQDGLEKEIIKTVEKVMQDSFSQVIGLVNAIAVKQNVLTKIIEGVLTYNQLFFWKLRSNDLDLSSIVNEEDSDEIGLEEAEENIQKIYKELETSKNSLLNMVEMHNSIKKDIEIK